MAFRSLGTVRTRSIASLEEEVGRDFRDGFGGQRECLSAARRGENP